LCCLVLSLNGKQSRTRSAFMLDNGETGLSYSLLVKYQLTRKNFIFLRQIFHLSNMQSTINFSNSLGSGTISTFIGRNNHTKIKSNGLTSDFVACASSNCLRSSGGAVSSISAPSTAIGTFIPADRPISRIN